jgi:hypothetical protein
VPNPRPIATAHIGLGLASILAFAFSVTLLVVNWKEAWADHREAARRWSHVVETFRTLRDDDRAWPENARDQLNAEYWEAARTTVVILENRFNSLKKRYLCKVAISEMSNTYPACPTILLALMLSVRHILRAPKPRPTTMTVTSIPMLRILPSANSQIWKLTERYLTVCETLLSLGFADEADWQGKNRAVSPTSRSASSSDKRHGRFSPPDFERPRPVIYSRVYRTPP